MCGCNLWQVTFWSFAKSPRKVEKHVFLSWFFLSTWCAILWVPWLDISGLSTSFAQENRKTNYIQKIEKSTLSGGWSKGALTTTLCQFVENFVRVRKLESSPDERLRLIVSEFLLFFVYSSILFFFKLYQFFSGFGSSLVLCYATVPFTVRHPPAERWIFGCPASTRAMFGLLRGMRWRSTPLCITFFLPTHVWPFWVSNWNSSTLISTPNCICCGMSGAGWKTRPKLVLGLKTPWLKVQVLMRIL